MSKNPDIWIELSAKAAVANVAAVRALLTPKTLLLAVVKAEAYGHGLLPMAKILKRYVDWFGVFNFEEAVKLRKSGIRKPILVMGPTPSSYFKQTSKLSGIRLSISSITELRRVPKDLPIHLKIDTGLSRLGILDSALSMLLVNAPASYNLEGVYTHLADAENFSNDKYTRQQFSRFKNALGILSEAGKSPKLTHVLASDGILRFPEEDREMVRCGLLLYGLWPNAEFARRYGKTLALVPVLSLKSRLVSIKTINRGTKVGYGVTEVVDRETKIAVVPVGYSDGYSRALSSKANVLVGGRRCRIIGRVSMNMIIIDVTALENATVGDEVVLLGRQGSEEINALELAELADTITYEIVTRLNPLIPRINVE